MKISQHEQIKISACNSFGITKAKNLAKRLTAGIIEEVVVPDTVDAFVKPR